jgi:cobalamin biosynthesis protein CobT
MVYGARGSARRREQGMPPSERVIANTPFVDVVCSRTIFDIALPQTEEDTAPDSKDKSSDESEETNEEEKEEQAAEEKEEEEEDEDEIVDPKEKLEEGALLMTFSSNLLGVGDLIPWTNNFS